MAKWVCNVCGYVYEVTMLRKFVRYVKLLLPNLQNRTLK